MSEHMRIAIGLFAIAVAALSQAEQQNRAPSAPGPQGMSPAVQTCIPCHGDFGEGKPQAGSPRIAGQSQYYLAKQLDNYADGSRRNPTMEPIAKGLSPELRSVVAAFYSQVDAPPAAGASPFTAAWSERGRVLATAGDGGRGVQACANCHGPDGVGQPPVLPYLAGLDAGYLRSALNAWRGGTRNNDAGQQMAVIANALSPEDVDAVARYFAGQPPPRPAPPNLLQLGHPQLMPSSMTRSMTVDSTVSDQPGTEARAPMAGGTFGIGDSGTSAETAGTGGAERSGGAASPSGSSPAPSGGTFTPPADAARGRMLVAGGTFGCTACHIVSGIRSPRGIVGPPLVDFDQRPFIAGQLPNRPDVLAAFLQNPPSLVPATGMPNVGLNLEEARHIAAYLYTLKATPRR